MFGSKLAESFAKFWGSRGAPVAVAAGVILSLAGCSAGGKSTSRLIKPSLTGIVNKPHVYSKEILSQSYHIDKKYPSMKGPDSVQQVGLLDTPEPELLWIVSYDAQVMDKEGKQQVSQEFMCHSNLDFNPRAYYDHFDSDAAMSGRLFTLSQGQQHIEFPKGHGIPIMSTEPLNLVTQVLNLNLEKPNLDVRHKVTIDFVRDSEVKGNMVPLYQAAVQGFKSLEDAPAHYGVTKDSKDDEEHGLGCSVGLPAVKGDVDKDAHGQKFTGHWVVKPGREENRTLVTKFLSLQFDTTIHYIAVHLHPFAESLEFIDRTDNKTVFKADVEATPGKIGIKRISHYSSVEGMKLHKDHEYELVSIYNNTSGEDQDSMAVMYLYVRDEHFRKPDVKKLQAIKEKANNPKAKEALPHDHSKM